MYLSTYLFVLSFGLVGGGGGNAMLLLCGVLCIKPRVMLNIICLLFRDVLIQYLSFDILIRTGYICSDVYEFPKVLIALCKTERS